MNAELTAAVFAVLDRRLSLQSSAPVALALSGGGDSMALLQLAAAWCARHGRRLIALTVDHGLNPESAGWTASAGRAAEAAGADWRALAWTGPKPSTGLPAAARQARHALLAEAARAAGARVVLMAHTLDDVLEGDLMRAVDAPGLPRLADWGPSPAWPEGRGVFLLRPLLAIRREALRDELGRRGIDWLEDPANRDPRFARARARAALEGGTAATPASNPPVCTPAAESTTADGRILFPRAPLDGRTLAAALLCAAGTTSPPRGGALARLQARLAAGESFQATLAGARIVAGPDEIALGREPGRQGLADLALGPGTPAVWDGRFEAVAERAELGLVALAGRIARLSRDERAALAEIPAWARGALPAVVAADGSISLPRPWGRAPVEARNLAAARLVAACGQIAHETAILA